MYAMYQIAKYSSDPKQSHGEAILYLVCYLMKTCDLGLKFKPDPKKGFECYCDADFTGNWNMEFAPMDPSTAKSQSRWIIFYAGCSISWASKLQSQILLSTTEAEYIALSQALCYIIPIMNLLQEMREQNFKVICIEPHVYCKVFEDNAKALELARLPKLRPWTIADMWEGGSSRSSPLTLKTRLLTHSQKLWHKMTTKVIAATCAVHNLSKQPK
jgi:hypothetical protein